jgi:hypothetical protein
VATPAATATRARTGWIVVETDGGWAPNDRQRGFRPPRGCSNASDEPAHSVRATQTMTPTMQRRRRASGASKKTVQWMTVVAGRSYAAEAAAAATDRTAAIEIEAEAEDVD